jgi:phage terminase large subunit-like protein
MSLIGFKALPWMVETTRALFGTIEVDTGLRQYRRAHISMAKKNGKSAFCGWLPLYHIDQENETDPRVVGIATTRKQASEVFDSAALLVDSSPLMQRTFEVIKSSKTIRHRSKAGRYEVLSADGDRNDGVRASLWICDELHRFKSSKEEGIRDAVNRATRGRKHPLGIDITTAGDPTESRLWLNEYAYACGVRDGTVKDRRYYVRIHEADPERLKSDPNFWKSKEARLQGNPSHEDHGGYITDEELVADLERAVQIPTEQRKYWRFTLNAQSESESKMFTAADWAACGAETKPLLGRRCYVGVDLSSTTDLTALVAVFPDDDGVLDILPFVWAPKERVPAIAKMLGPFGTAFQQWVTDGLIETTEGNQVDYRAVENKIAWLASEFDLVEIDYDKWNAADMIQRVMDTGVRCVEISQGVALSAAIKELQKRVLARTIRHGNHPVLAWMASCSKAKPDPNENLRLVKAVRNEEAARVDGIAALITALSRAMVDQGATSAPFAVEMW